MSVYRQYCVKFEDSDTEYECSAYDAEEAAREWAIQFDQYDSAYPIANNVDDTPTIVTVTDLETGKTVTVRIDGMWGASYYTRIVK